MVKILKLGEKTFVLKCHLHVRYNVRYYEYIFEF